MSAEVLDAHLINTMPYGELCEYLSEALSAAGYRVEVPDSAQGQEIDFLLVDENQKKTVAALWRNNSVKVSAPFLRKLLRAQGHYSATYGMVVSRMPLSGPAKKLADQHDLIVWDREHIEANLDGMTIGGDDVEAESEDLMPDDLREEVENPPEVSVDEMSEDEVDALGEALRILEQMEQEKKENRLRREYHVPFDYSAPPGPDNIGPYDWQMQFHNAGKNFQERCLIAANRIGKTHCGAAECAFHLTGEYPSWWNGKRFTEPTRGWVGSDTNETSREIVQKALIGSPRGTGWIPKDRIVDVTYRQAGIPDVIDSITVRHINGGISRLLFKTYEQGRKKWQGTSIHFVWFDEEPPLDIFTEGMTRVLDTRGLVMVTFTPLSGASEVVMHFIDGGDGIWVFNATWDDAPHLTDEDKRRMLASFPEHERATRARGTPMVGSGVVYPTPDEDVMVDAFQIPSYYRRICGIDFGIDHPFAAVWLAHDADSDVLYLYDCYKASGQTAAYHADCIKKRGDWIPVSWPHDGMHRDKASGQALKEQYRKKGVNMLPISARYTDDKGGAVAREPIVQEIDERMRTGRLKVFSHLSDWFREKRMYHRKDGVIVAEMDDLLSATNYATMMLRFARNQERRILPARTADYDPLARI